MLRTSSAAILCLLSACDPSEPAGSGGGPSSGSQIAASTSGADASTSQSSASTGGFDRVCASPDATAQMDCGTLRLAASDVKSRPRNHHFSALANTDAGAFLYVMGGVDGMSAMKFVDRFAVHADGSLGASEPQGTLPVALGGMTGGLIGKTIVIAGGMRSTGPTDASYWAVVGADGTLGPFATGGSTARARMHPGSVTQADAIYVLGGFSHPDVWDDVVKATVAPDGSLGEWSNAGTLPGKLSHFATTLVGDHVYLTGGLDKSAYTNPPPLKSTWRARLVNGALGEWTPTTDLPRGIVTHASFYYGGHLYVAGGIVPGGQEDRILRAPILEDRSLGAWEELPVKLSNKRGHVHQLPMFENHFYSIAGAVDYALKSTDTIDVGTFVVEP